jgi:1-deoxy-D-xylulose-5-phosphate synthase
MLTAAEEAAALLAADGIELTVWDVRLVSEPDPAMVADAARHDTVITAEDGVRQGGAGMFLADAIRASCSGGTAPPVVSLGIPRAYIPQGKPNDILSQLGLDGPGLARSAREAWEAHAVQGDQGARGGASGRSRKVGGDSPAGPPPSLPVTMTAKDTLD